jgi:hypothetical protein
MRAIITAKEVTEKNGSKNGKSWEFTKILSTSGNTYIGFFQNSITKSIVPGSNVILEHEQLKTKDGDYLITKINEVYTDPVTQTSGKPQQGAKPGQKLAEAPKEKELNVPKLPTPLTELQINNFISQAIEAVLSRKEFQDIDNEKLLPLINSEYQARLQKQNQEFKIAMKQQEQIFSLAMSEQIEKRKLEKEERDKLRWGK